MMINTIQAKPVAFVLLLVLLVHAKTLSNPPFSYDPSSPNGPSHWKTNYPLCGVSFQSPINIVTDKALPLPGTCFVLSTAPVLPSYNLVERLEHTLEVVASPRFANRTRLFSSFFTTSDIFNLDQFHFHSPSEHTINGVHTDLEVHYLHTSADNSMAVVSVLYNISSAKSEMIDDLLEVKRNLTRIGGTAFATVSLNFGKQKSLYHYAGSTTTPPCASVPNWFILGGVQSLTTSQFEELRPLISDGPNNRPVQPLDSRIVYRCG